MENFLAYWGLYCTIGYVLLCATISRRRVTLSDDSAPPGWLKLLAILSVIGPVGITLLYRILPDHSAMLSWECDTTQAFFIALQNRQGIGEFMWNTLVHKPGLLSASAQTLMYGVPTYVILMTAGWSFATLRITSLIMGLASLALGAYVMRILFNRTAALLFIIVIATNPLFIFYMGYGVAQTATLFGLELALALVISAITDKSRWAYSKSVAASLALFAANYNYAPARIFVVATLAFLALFALYGIMRRPRCPKASAISVLIAIITTTLILSEKRLNLYSDLTTVRGEQAFVMARQKEELRHYLGESAEAGDLNPDQLSFQKKVAFFWAIAAARTREMLQLFSPLRRSDTYYLRGHTHGANLSPYQSGMIIPLIIGFVASIRSRNKLPAMFLGSLVFLGTLPLLLTNRVDNHRSFLMLIPLGGWMAYGLSLCVERLRGGLLATAHCAIVFCITTAMLFAHDLFFLAIRDDIPTPVMLLSQHLAEQFKDDVTIATPGMDCAQQAILDVGLASSAHSRGLHIDRVFPADAALDLTDARFNTASPGYKLAMEWLKEKTLVIASSSPMTLLSADLRSKGYALRTKNIDNYAIVTASSTLQE